MERPEQNFNYLLSIAKVLEPNFHIEPNTELELIYINIFEYFESMFINEPDYKPELDTRKGLLLIGSVGSGKTLCLKIFQKFLQRFIKLTDTAETPAVKKLFTIVSMKELVYDFSSNGVSGISQYLRNELLTEYNVRICKPVNLLIDDFGAVSDSVNRFGNEHNFADELIQARYDIWKEYNKQTYITTNLNLEMIKARYDERTVSRLQEMVNIIVFPVKDYRKG